jgi:hypothetical protein
MKRLKAGPELKMPDLKVPDFLVDLYWDLRDRRLLPLVGLAIVAIVAVPFLLGGGSEEEEAAPAIAGASSAPSPERAGAKLTVVEAKPGLRDYRKRLREHPTDPFVQRYTSPQLGGTKLGGGSGGEGSASPTSTVTKTTSSSTTKVTKTEKSDGTTTEVVSETGSGSSPGGAGSGELTLFSFAVDLKIVRTETKPDGSKETSDPEIRHRVLPPAALPSEKEQAVTYMGISPKTQQPLFLISDAVSSLFGEANCLSGAETCQLIEVAPGLPMTYVYGPSSTRYKITVLKVEPVVAGQADAPR